jgi:hypothetical protein
MDSQRLQALDLAAAGLSPACGNARRQPLQTRAAEQHWRVDVAAERGGACLPRQGTRMVTIQVRKMCFTAAGPLQGGPVSPAGSSLLIDSS